MLDDDDDDDDGLEMLCANIRVRRKKNKEKKKKKKKRFLLQQKATTNSLNGWDLQRARSFAVKEQMQKRNAPRLMVGDQRVGKAKNRELYACA